MQHCRGKIYGHTGATVALLVLLMDSPDIDIIMPSAGTDWTTLPRS
ncbi:MAG: hypothetical protein LKH45_04675 [Acetobacter sp.]|nr:hypothetical protein [Acetobacter sp.]